MATLVYVTLAYSIAILFEINYISLFHKIIMERTNSETDAVQNTNNLLVLTVD